MTEHFQFYKKIQRNVIRKTRPVIVNFRWQLYSRVLNWKGISASCSSREEINKKRPHEIIVSLTTFPARVGTVNETIKSLLLQSIKPDRVILWLAATQFPDSEKSLPIKLLSLKKYGLEIKWCEDIRSYKKLIPSLREFPNSIIVTADDDVYYSHNWLRTLYNAYLSDPNVLWAHRITKFIIEDKKYKSIPEGNNLWNNPTFLHKLTGVGGCLYAPGMLYKDVTDANLFTNICPTNDDIWFWLMAVLNGTKTMAPSKKDNLIVYVPGTQEGPSLTQINDHGEKLFWRDFYSMIDKYPQLDDILREEFRKIDN
ncbi:hypothetical protein [Butyrivibrio sp. YAB3001]|uniref:hypothetical protein n=1 Tax=Butyrivibrio sp. YAB3001 TaxID=1520812 RepID=UPI0008F63588|nr:hypothetical protein [Butyrivibrio sp. YAB3001]SFC98485.1 hypothetical protein SAMN02910398_03708 [Butyrivibrio sp. YAB3001]